VKTDSLVAQSALLNARRLQQTVARDSPGVWGSSTRLALLHHHPLPLADLSRGPSNRDEYLLLKNAGVFLRELVKLGVDVVLHGHKHSSAIARLVLPTSPNGEDELLVLGVGSVARPGTAELPSYNVVRLYDSGRVVLERRCLRATYEADPPIVLRDYEQQRPRHSRRLLAESPLTLRAEGLRYHFVIDSNGDAVTESTFTQVRSASESSVTYVQRFLKTRAGRPGNPTYQTLTPGTSIRFSWSGPPNAEGRREGRLEFSPPLRRDPISFIERHPFYNVFCFDQATRSAITGAPTDSEHASYRVEKALETFGMAITFPPYRFPTDFELQVFDSRDRLDLEESDFARRFLHVIPASRTVGFLLASPLPSFRYQIQWRLPAAAAEEFPLTAAQEAMVDRFIAALDEFVGDERDGPSPLAPLLHDLWDRVQNGLQSLGEQTDASLEVHFYVASPDTASIRYASCAGAARKVAHEVISGDSIVGQAFRRRTFLPCVAAHHGDSASPPTYYEPREVDGGSSALAAYPLLVPSVHGRPVGVLLLVSRAPGSSLCSALSDEARVKDLEEILFLWYRTTLSEAIGLPEVQSAWPSRTASSDTGCPGGLVQAGAGPAAPVQPPASLVRRPRGWRRARRQDVERRLLRLERRVGFAIQETVIRWELLDLEGTVRQTWLHRGVTVREDFALEAIRLGVFTPGPAESVEVEPPTLSYEGVRPGAEYRLRASVNPRGEIEVSLQNARGGRLEIDGGSFGVSRVMAHAARVWREDVESAFEKDRIQYEYARAQAISPTRVLKLEVGFPPGYAVQAFPLVFKGSGEVLDDSAARAGALSFEFSGNGGTLEVTDPTDGRFYGIGWTSPSRGDRRA